jgi:hypothetical protein
MKAQLSISYASKEAKHWNQFVKPTLRLHQFLTQPLLGGADDPHTAAAERDAAKTGVSLW